MDAARALASNLVKTRYEDLPADVVEVTKRSILDTLGVIAGGSTQGQGAKEIVELVKESAAKGQSTIIGFGGRVPSWMAGFANGAMSHQLDYDDVHDDAGLHPSACTVPAAFAVAEELGGISGKEFITASALAIDVVSRMGLSISKSSHGHVTDWFPSHLFGFYAATAAAGRILGLNEDQMLDALGHTLQQAAGSQQVLYVPGSVFRGIRDGFAIKGGILSALMAKKGLPGTKDSLEGKGGLFGLYFGNKYDRSFLVDGLGKKFEGSNVGFKPWPSCRLTHAPIDAALSIVQTYDIHPEDIKEINATIAKRAMNLIEPLETRRRPKTVTDAKFSLLFTLGLATLKRRVIIKDFTMEGLKDPAVLDMAQRVTWTVDPTLSDDARSATVTIKTKNGKQYSEKIAGLPYGHPRKPIAKEDLVAKFRDCVSFSATPVPPANVEKVIALVDDLERVTDVRKVIRLLA